MDYLGICESLLKTQLGDAVRMENVGKHLAHFVSGGFLTRDAKAMMVVQDGDLDRGHEMGRTLRQLCRTLYTGTHRIRASSNTSSGASLFAGTAAADGAQMHAPSSGQVTQGVDANASTANRGSHIDADSLEKLQCLAELRRRLAEDDFDLLAASGEHGLGVLTSQEGISRPKTAQERERERAIARMKSRLEEGMHKREEPFVPVSKAPFDR
jgi:hypothetical protein